MTGLSDRTCRNIAPDPEEDCHTSSTGKLKANYSYRCEAMPDGFNQNKKEKDNNATEALNKKSGQVLDFAKLNAL